MLTIEDIQKLTEYQLTIYKEVFAAKTDLTELENRLTAKLDKLTGVVDSFAKEITDNRVERVVTEERLKRVEEAVKTVAKLAGITVNV